LYVDLTDREKSKEPLLYLDEVNFTKRSVQSLDWSGKNSNITVDQRQIYTGYKSVIAAVNKDRKRCLIHIYDQAIDQEDFEQYLRVVSKWFKGKPIRLMMDNLGVHKARAIKDVYSELKITPVYNVAYSPDYNAIESVFSIVKKEFCKQRLTHLANNLEFDFPKHIRAAFKTVTKTQI
jgi:transposase